MGEIMHSTAELMALPADELERLIAEHPERVAAVLADGNPTTADGQALGSRLSSGALHTLVAAWHGLDIPAHLNLDDNARCDVLLRLCGIEPPAYDALSENDKGKINNLMQAGMDAKAAWIEVTGEPAPEARTH